MRKELFGYSKSQVKKVLNGYEDKIEMQKKDIERLKADNEVLKNSLFEISSELSNFCKKDNC